MVNKKGKNCLQKMHLRYQRQSLFSIVSYGAHFNRFSGMQNVRVLSHFINKNFSNSNYHRALHPERKSKISVHIMWKNIHVYIHNTESLKIAINSNQKITPSPTNCEVFLEIPAFSLQLQCLCERRLKEIGWEKYLALLTLR